MKTRIFVNSILVILLLSGVISGQTPWAAIGPNQGETIVSLHFDTNTNTLFSCSTEGFSYYDEGNGNWTSREEVGWIGRQVWSLTTHPEYPGRIITGRENAFFKGYIEISEDWGVSSQVVYSSQGGSVKDIKYVPGTYNTFFACTISDIVDGELLKSVDGGFNWTLLSNYSHHLMTQLAVHPADSNIVYVSGDALVTKTTDGGISWQSASNGLPSTLGVYSIVINPSDPDVLLCSNDNGIYRTSDGGDNWALIDSYVCRNFTVNSDAPDIFYAVTFSPYNLIRSTDMGLSWHEFNSSYPADTMMDLVYSQNSISLYTTSSQQGVYSLSSPYVPVELTSFNGKFSKGAVLLEWVTATEVNNLGFEIQRMVNGEETWEILDFIDGAGTTTEKNEYEFTDENPVDGINKYRLKQTDMDGSFEYSGILSVETQNFASLPTNFQLHQNYPNPFNPSTKIKFSVGQICNLSCPGITTTLKIYNSLGAEAATLVNELKSPGTYEVEWNAAGFASGIYFCEIKSGNFRSVRKIILMK